MNILIVTQLYPQPDDMSKHKATKTVEYFAREWVNDGHKILIVHCPSKFPLVFYFAPAFIKKILGGTFSNLIPSRESRNYLYRQESGIEIVRFPMLKLFPGMGYSDKRILAQSQIIYKFLSDKQFIPELILGHFANPSTGIVSSLARIYGVGSSIVFHRDFTKKNIKKYHLFKWLENIDAVGARSIFEAEKIEIISNHTIAPFVCYSGVPNSAVDSAPKKCEKMIFERGVRYLFVGSFISRKRVDSVINAFAHAKRNNDTLTIIGGGILENKLRKLSSKIKPLNSVSFTGQISRGEVLKYMNDSHIFALISKDETFGMVYFEAMLHGCIVIASQGGGFDGIIVDGYNGFLCLPGDTRMLIEVFEKIASLSVSERNKIGQAAIETAREYSEQQVARKYLSDVFDRLSTKNE